jgi:hypothetical protein
VKQNGIESRVHLLADTTYTYSGKEITAQVYAENIRVELNKLTSNNRPAKLFT